jgi:Holliday junction resolvase-like predicted endonuclease
MGLCAAEELLKDLKSRGLADIRDDLVSVRSEGRLELALQLISAGVDPESVSKTLAWGEFEDLVSRILELCDYFTLRHTIVKNGRKRYEIDVVAAKKPVILCMDCKHWKRSWLRSAYSEVVKKQVERTRAFSLPINLSRKLDVKGWKWADLFPVVVTLSPTPIIMFNDVPVVSIYKLGGFLREFESHRYTLKKIRVEWEGHDEGDRSVWERA